jgi:hypothetical protein
MFRQFPAASLAVGDIVRGIVLHLDPGELKNCGAKCSCDIGSQVTGNHFFLCLDRDDDRGDWIPMFSRPGPGRLEISATGRGGHPKWTQGAFYFHPEQVWTATHEAVVAAALEAGDRSTPRLRNTLDESEIPVF